jgi:hypothetical protein
MNSRSNCGPRRHPAIGSPLPCADSDRSESFYSLTLLISFLLGDPAGTWVDVIQQIDPKPGFWDKYLVR